MVHSSAITWGKFNKRPVYNGVGRRQETSKDNTVGYWWSLLIPISLKGQGCSWNLETKKWCREGQFTENISPSRNAANGHYKERGGVMKVQASGLLPPSNLHQCFPRPNQPRARGQGSLLKLSNGQGTEQCRKSWSMALEKETDWPNMNLKKNHCVMKFLRSHKRHKKVY